MTNASNRLFLGDNLDVLTRFIDDESVDLVYLDPPFKSNRNYHLTKSGAKRGGLANDETVAFGDVWQWNDDAETAYAALQTLQNPKLLALLGLFRATEGDTGLTAYLVMMGLRLPHLWRVLKPTGSLYLHCDPTTSHYLKLMLDTVFGLAYFQNELIWYYRGGGVSKKRFARKHDVILFYTKSSHYCFNADAVRVPYSEESAQRLRYKARAFREGKVYDAYEAHPQGKHPDDVWLIQPVMPSAKERLGYPTQKPLALLEKMVLASSNRGDVVLDPFCGGGTTVHAAEINHRCWIGIDKGALAIEMTQARLGQYCPEASYVFESPNVPNLR